MSKKDREKQKRAQEKRIKNKLEIKVYRDFMPEGASGILIRKVGDVDVYDTVLPGERPPPLPHPSTLEGLHDSADVVILPPA